MKDRILILVVLVLVIVQPCFSEEDIREVVGSISEVIVYRGQALVSRTIEVELPGGSSEMVVQELPKEIVPESLYAQALGEVTVTSVRYREKAVREDTREEVKKLDAEIEEVKNRSYQAKRDLNIACWLFSHFEQQWKLSVDAANADLNRGVMDSESIEKFMSHLEEKAIEWHEKTVEIEFRQKELEKELELLQRQLQELQAGRSRTEREAVLVVNSPNKKRTTIELRYLVNNANWLPQYNLRAEPDESKVTVEYNAIMHQASGEDWDDVALSLSTAQPTMAAGAPVLEPIEVEVTETGGRWWSLLRSKRAASAPREGELYDKSVYRDLSDEFNKLQSERQQIARKGKVAQSALNKVAMDNQLMEFYADEKAAQVMQEEAVRFARTEGVSVTYDLGSGLSMPSRSDQQLITIASFEAKADFLMIGIPLLTNYVYLQADIINDSEVILLAGPCSMYRNGEFVGKGQLEMVTMGEKFTAGFGVDSQIQISREFKDKKVDTLWGNRVEKYDYRIAIDNYKNTQVKLRLLERIPYTEDEELEIKDFQTNVPLSKDPEYLRAEKDKGVLRWDLTLAPATAEEKATIVTYSYSMVYDNDMNIRPVSRRGNR